MCSGTHNNYSGLSVVLDCYHRALVVVFHESIIISTTSQCERVAATANVMLRDPGRCMLCRQFGNGWEFRALSSCHRRWTSPVRCGLLHQSNSVSQHPVPKRHDIASVSCTFQWDCVAMLGVSSCGKGNSQTDGSNRHLSSDVGFFSVILCGNTPVWETSRSFVIQRR
jgi:hypothetical protein